MDSEALQKSKEYKYVWTLHNPMYSRLLVAISLVKEFIIKNNLIIYGGEAMDYALRLKGDHIYPDELLTIPDLDFFSPNHVEHSYQLADIFYINGFEEARSIVAIHVHTMKVDCGSNNFMADISYCPQDMMDKIPTLVYNGMRVVHPDYQRIDIHSAISFLFNDPPAEVVFNRLKKDVQRFNKIAHHYPIQSPTNMPKLHAITKLPCVFPNVSFCGLTGFSILRRCYDEFVAGVDAKLEPIDWTTTIPAAYYKNNTWHVYNIEFAYDWTADPITTFELQEARIYEPYHNIIPRRIEATIDEQPVLVYSTQYKLLASNEVNIDDQDIEVANAQYILCNLIAHYQFTKSKIHLHHYVVLLKMIANIERAAIAKATPQDHLTNSPFFPTTRIYGSANESYQYHIAIERLLANKMKTPQPKLPTNYNVKKKALKLDVEPTIEMMSQFHPTFDYRSSKYFRDEGLQENIESTPS